MNRRDFLKTVAATAVLPVVGDSPATTWAVDRGNMWAPDATSEETLARCDRLLAADDNCILALCHRGQVSSFVRAKALAEADLMRAIGLEASPALFYIRGVTLDRTEDLRHAINLLTAGGDIGGTAICTSQPDIYKWTGTDDGELLYLSYRELGSAEEGQGHVDEALVAFERAASFRVISQPDLERWCEGCTKVGRWCEAVVSYKRLIGMQAKPEYFKRLEECESWTRAKA